MKAIIEIPAGTRNKYEKSPDGLGFILDRVVAEPYPYSYGYILGTLAEDLDSADVFVLTKDPIHPGIAVDLEVLGMIKMLDNGVEDHKILAIPKGSEPPNDFIFARMYSKIMSFLATYKDGVFLGGFRDKQTALDYIQKCVVAKENE